MAVLADEPQRLTQGESIAFQKSFPPYPSSTWTCTYYFRGPSSLDKVSTPSTSDSFLTTLTTADTSKLKSGNYRYQAFVSQGIDKYLVSQGSLVVQKSLATSVPCDAAGNSTLKGIVEALEASIAGLATQNQLEVIVGNVQVRYMSLDEKIRAHEYFSRLLSNEEAQQAIEDAIIDGSGGTKQFGRTIYTRFRNPA